jgi:hypothetical protein
MPMARLPVAGMAAEAPPVPAAEIMHGPTVPMVVMAKMSEVVPVEAVIAVKSVAETRTEAAVQAANAAGAGIDSGERDSEDNSRGNGEGFS